MQTCPACGHELYSTNPWRRAAEVLAADDVVREGATSFLRRCDALLPASA